MYFLLFVLVRSYRDMEQNFSVPFVISIIILYRVLVFEKRIDHTSVTVKIILLTFCTVCGSLYPLAINASLSCLLVAIM